MIDNKTQRLIRWFTPLLGILLLIPTWDSAGYSAGSSILFLLGGLLLIVGVLWTLGAWILSFVSDESGSPAEDKDVTTHEKDDPLIPEAEPDSTTKNVDEDESSGGMALLGTIVIIGLVVVGIGLAMPAQHTVQKTACATTTYDGDCAEDASVQYAETEQNPMRLPVMGFGGIMLLGGMLGIAVKSD